MQTLKILLVEDELLIAEELAAQLVSFGYAITDHVTNSDDALSAFKKRIPDLVLLDIQLRGSKLDGIELAKEINSIEKIPIIFLTGISDIETSERAKVVDPAYYLIKPCNPLQLRTALDYALYNFTYRKRARIEDSLKFNFPPQCALYSTKDYFFARVNSKFVRVEIADIIYVKAESPGNYVRIVTEVDSFLQSLGLKDFSMQVPHTSLIRVSRSYLVNMNKIIAFDKGRVFVQVKDSQIEISIGSSFKSDFSNNFPKLRSK